MDRSGVRMMGTLVSDNYFLASLHDSPVTHDAPVSHDRFPLRDLTRRLLGSPGVEENEGQSKCTDCSENHEQADNDEASQ